MPVIVVDAAAHCHGPEVVEALARRLGLDRVDDWALFATAADRYGMSPKKLQRQLSEPPSFFGTPRRERVRQVAVLRACIADEVAKDGWIYQGLVGHLLPRTLTHVLKVCLAGTHDWRVDRAVAAGLSRRDADRVVSRDDETRAEWTSLVADSGPWDTSLYDVFLPMHEHSIDEAVEMLAGYATQSVLAFTPAVQRAIRDFQLAAAVGVALTEHGHDVDVEANDGRVTILIKHHSMFLERHQKELEEIAGSVGGVTSASARPGPDYAEPGVAFKVELDVPSKVLLVDDEREFVHTLSERLQSRRFTPAIAYDGEQALEMVRNDEPDTPTRFDTLRDRISNGSGGAGSQVRPHLSGGGYRRLRRSVVLATATVSLAPLLITNAINYIQYRQVIRTEAAQQISRLTLNLKRSLELFLSERRSALTFINNDRSFDELCSEAALNRIIDAMNRSLAVGAFVDLGLIDDDGEQLCYSGPYQLEGRNYADQDWFHEVARRGTFTSDVFLGFRELPHFVIASRHARPDGGFYILRATIDAEMLSDQVMTAGLEFSDDVFLVNREGVLQTPSRRYGPVLNPIALAVPVVSTGVEVAERRDEAGRPVFLASAAIDGSPFVLMMVKPVSQTMGRWFTLRSELIGFSVISAALILGVILWGSALFVNNMREASLRRAALMHQVEYTNKLASIGRLAAGVAHEINNPLAIINEKAGLLHDLVGLDDGMPQRDKLLGLVDSILRSVERCKAITHRLLGFARHMDVTSDTIDISALLKEVLGFLGKEAEYRNLDITLSVDDDLPTLVSDRGQLQQVFLNILNNALAAVSDGGRITIQASRLDDGHIAISIADDGVGISADNLERIFEPFFTTKEGIGTGLGLSITYGIVNKLGGHIDVESEPGVGTRFTVVLPTARHGEARWTE